MSDFERAVIHELQTQVEFLTRQRDTLAEGITKIDGCIFLCGYHEFIPCKDPCKAMQLHNIVYQALKDAGMEGNEGGKK